MGRFEALIGLFGVTWIWQQFPLTGSSLCCTKMPPLEHTHTKTHTHIHRYIPVCLLIILQKTHTLTHMHAGRIIYSAALSKPPLQWPKQTIKHLNNGNVNFLIISPLNYLLWQIIACRVFYISNNLLPALSRGPCRLSRPWESLFTETKSEERAHITFSELCASSPLAIIGINIID